MKTKPGVWSGAFFLPPGFLFLGKVRGDHRLDRLSQGVTIAALWPSRPPPGRALGKERDTFDGLRTSHLRGRGGLSQRSGSVGWEMGNQDA